MRVHWDAGALRPHSFLFHLTRPGTPPPAWPLRLRPAALAWPWPLTSAAPPKRAFTNLNPLEPCLTPTTRGQKTHEARGPKAIMKAHWPLN